MWLVFPQCADQALPMATFYGVASCSSAVPISHIRFLDRDRA